MSISARLRAAREARGIDLYRVERDTKIRVKFLAALEEGQYSELPAEVYARGFLRNYASYLGLDPDEAWEEWRRESAAPRPSAPVVVDSAEAAQPAVQFPPRSGGRARARSSSGTPSSGTPPSADSAPEAAAGGAFALKLPELKLPQLKLPALQRAAKVPPAELAQSRPPKPEPSILKSPPPRARLSSISERLPWRRTKAPKESPIGGPQPIAMPRRALHVGPTHVVVLLLLVIIAGVGLFFGMQATLVLQDPTLTVTSPGQAVITVASGTTSYPLQGTATKSAEISISWDQRDPMHTQANASGNWNYKAALHNGINEFDIYSTDLDTGHDSAVVTRLINVETPTASPVAPFLAVDSPTNGQSFVSGSITVYGTTVAITSVTVTATYVGTAPPAPPSGKATNAPTRTPAPTQQPTMMPMATSTPFATASPTPSRAATPNPSAGPTPITVIPDINGRFSTPLRLYSGRWLLTVVGTNKDGVSTTPVQLTVIVTAGSLVVVINVKGGPADLKIWKDGKILAGYDGPPYKRVASGSQIKVVANQSVWIFTGSPNTTYVTVNGTSYGRLGTGSTNSPASWRITAYGPPVPSNDR
ncbi:MAG: helix-turn-helix domain-containing protein [Candidatus Limnocylindrales bacterium]|jgi:transcriptional regulator with XRE-family HTH domain